MTCDGSGRSVYPSSNKGEYQVDASKSTAGATSMPPRIEKFCLLFAITYDRHGLQRLSRSPLRESPICLLPSK